MCLGLKCVSFADQCSSEMFCEAYILFLNTLILGFIDQKADNNIYHACNGCKIPNHNASMQKDKLSVMPSNPSGTTIV